MDCDNDHSENPAAWKAPADVADEFPNAEFYVADSRNNMKEKNGRAAVFSTETADDPEAL